MDRLSAFSGLFKALGDVNRLTICLLLFKREMCVCEIVQCLPVSFSTVSSHLRLLQGAGIVKSRKEGKWVFYSLESDRFIRKIIGDVFNSLKNDEFFSEMLKKVDKLSPDVCSLKFKE